MAMNGNCKIHLGAVAAFVAAAVLLSSCGASSKAAKTSGSANSFSTQSTPAQKIDSIKWTRVLMDSTYDDITDFSATKLISSYDSLLQPLQRIVGYSERELLREQPESAIADFAVDAMREMGAKSCGHPVDVGLLNFGGIRNDMPKGAVRVYDIYSIFPFNNTVIVAKMTGRQLKELVADIIANGKIQPMSGVRMTVAGRKIVDLAVGGKPVDETATYYLATIDFLYSGGDRIFVSKHCESFESTSLFIRDALIDYIDGLTAEGKMIDTMKDGRVKVLKNVSELDLDE